MMQVDLKKKLLEELMDDLDMREGESALKPKVAEVSVTKVEPGAEMEEEDPMPQGRGAMMNKIAGLDKGDEDEENEEDDLKSRLKNFMGGK